MRRTKSAHERFWPKVRESSNGCLVWTAADSGNGYGVFWDGSRQMMAHRWSYEAARGPIPAGLSLDHLCRNRRCVNPDHLEAVTPRENNRRGYGPVGLNARKTHCEHGHLLDGANLAICKGHRACRVCNRRRTAVWRTRHGRREMPLSGPNVKTWHGWYHVARDEMAFRYGVRGVPKDRYKEQFSLGRTPFEAAKEIYQTMQARGEA